MTMSSIVPGPNTINLLKMIVPLLKAIFKRPKKEEAPQDIAQRNAQMRALCDHVNDRARQVEEAVVKELRQYGEYLEDLSRSEEYEFLARHRIGTSGFVRQIDLLSMHIPGLIASEVSCRLSESDGEFSRIRCMLSGPEKEAAMQTFTTNVIQNAVEKSADQTERIIDSIQEEFFSLLREEMERSQRQLEKTEQELAALRIADGDVVEQTRLQTRARQVCQCCDLVDELMR